MRLGSWHRRFVLAALIAVALSGVLRYVLHDLVGLDSGELPHDVLVVHGVASFAALIAFGSLLPIHLLVGWRQGRNRWSGAIVLALYTTLIATALLLYYAGGEETQAWSRLVHLVVGGVAIVGLPLHMILGRSLRIARKYSLARRYTGQGHETAS
jgi:hypothetical protein